MIETTKSKLYVRACSLLFAGCAALVVTGACSSGDERQRAIELAGGCLINSDCAKLLVCAFGRCHKECDEDRDCAHDLRCVKSEEPGIFICQLEDETVCKSNDHCPGDQVCGVDLECRDSCKDDGDCLESTQICSESNECASTDAMKDMLDESGALIPFDPDAAGSGGSGGSGATAGTGGGSSAAGPGGAGGGDEPMSSGGAGGEPSTTGAAGSGNEAGAPPDSDVDFEEPDGPELVDNDTREKAVPIQTSARLHIAKAEEDWLSYTPPDDGRAHVISVHIEQAAAVSAMLAVVSKIGFAPIGSTALGEGTHRDVYFTIGSGVTALLQLSSTGTGSPGMLELTIVDVPEVDAQEPNNDYDQAARIELGEIVTGQLLSPFVSLAENPNEDWFELELAAGSATFELLDVPDDGQLQVVRRDAQGNPQTLGHTTAGAIKSFPMTSLLAGTHQFLIVPYGKSVVSYASPTKPSYFSEQYSFKITQ